MMPRAELGIDINLSSAGIDINFSYAGIDINSILVLNPMEGGGNYLNSIPRLASLANHSLAALAIKHLVSTIILTLSYASLRSPITRSIRSQSNT